MLRKLELLRLVLTLVLTQNVSAQNDFAEEIPGEAGLDYPILSNIPDTSFSCLNRVNGGYYADVETDCQVFHVCGSASAIFGSVTYSFLCPNGTTFHQQYFTCDWWYNVDCGASQDFYDLNNLLGLEEDGGQQQVIPSPVPATQAPDLDQLPTYGNRKNRKQRDKAKANPVRVKINKEAELFPFPNFPSQNQRLRTRRRDVDILTNQKSFLTLNERFPRDFDFYDEEDEDDFEMKYNEDDEYGYNYVKNPIFN